MSRPPARPFSRLAPSPESTLGQLGALVGLRWQMVRSGWVRAGLALAVVVVPALVVLGVLGARSFPSDLRFDAAVLTPTAFLGFAALALVAPLTSGGGNELFPADELVAFPVRPGTLFAASLAVAPLNLVWLTQLIVLFTLSAFVLPDDALVWPAMLLTSSYVVFVSVVGQAVSWIVVGMRQTHRGRRVTWTLAGLGLTAAVLLVRTGQASAVLDRSPTLAVVTSMMQSSVGIFTPAATAVTVMTVLTVLGYLAGVRAVAWALRRPGDVGTRESRPVRRRAIRRSVLGELTAVDRASVWRSVTLRRGALVLGVLPGLVAAGAGVGWDSLAILPGLVAAGAGLLFGVNAFCLDASGALWLASLPHPARLAVKAKGLVLLEVTSAAVLLALLAGMLRAPGAPTLPQAVGVVLAAVVAVALVVATCLRLSVTHPHRADLRGPRDTPAPPATMALYSARLAGLTTASGVLIAGAASGPSWWPPVVVALPMLAYAALSLRRTLRRYDRPAVRARVTATVAAG